MARSGSALSRREWLMRASIVLPAMHAGLIGNRAIANEQVSGSPVRFNELTLHTRDLASQRSFYTDVLQLPVLHEGPDRLTYRAGATRLTFEPSAAGESPFYHFAFNIPENKLDFAIEWMEGRGDILTWHRTGKQIIHFKQWNAHSVYFFDPAGNILEFIAHHELDNAAGGAFSVDDILCINEIGVVVDDVSALVSELDERLDAKPFLNWSPEFAPVGDREGLFICVKAGRVWLPTKDVKAKESAVSVTQRAKTLHSPMTFESAPGLRVAFESAGVSGSQSLSNAS